MTAPTITSVDSETTSQQLVAANSARFSVVISNTDANVLYWRYGADPATTIAGGFTDYLNWGDTVTITGPEAALAIQGIWDADGAGGASITQLIGTPLAGAGLSSILEIVQQAAPRLGLEVPDGVFSSPEREHVELKEVCNEALQMIQRAHRWQKLIQEAIYTGDGVTTAFDLPDDFGWLADAENVWGSSTRLPFHHITSTDDWLGIEVQNTSLVVNSWIMYGGQIHIKPALAVGATARHFYQSTAAVQPVSGSAKSRFTIDTDTFRLDDQLLKLAIIYRWKQDRGLPYAEHMTDYETLKEKLIARDKGGRVIKVGAGRMPRGVTGAYPLNVPVT